MGLNLYIIFWVFDLDQLYFIVFETKSGNSEYLMTNKICLALILLLDKPLISLPIHSY